LKFKTTETYDNCDVFSDYCWYGPPIKIGIMDMVGAVCLELGLGLQFGFVLELRSRLGLELE